MKTIILIGLGVYIGKQLFSGVPEATSPDKEAIRKRLMRYLAENQPLLPLKDRMRDAELIINS